jgi:putative methionine-R-sulfoxide reductase with GAF domain/HAMP domain-containing protein
MFEKKLNSSGLDERQKQIGLWAAGIFTIIGLAFFGYSAYTLFFAQQGQAGIEDKVLLPVTILMFVVSVISFFLIRRDRFIPGIWLLILANLIIPTILGVLVLRNIYPIVITYLITLITLLVFLVFPRASRWQALVAAALTILSIIGIELWNPAFRGATANLSNFTSGVVILAALGFLAFFVRQAFVGNILTKLIVSFVVIAVFSVGVAAFSSQQALSTSLTESIGNNLSELSNARAVEIALSVDREKDILEVLSLNKSIRQTALEAVSAVPLSQADITRLDEQWRAADAADNNADPLVASVINNALASELRSFQGQFPQHVEVFLTNLQGVSIASTNRTSDYLQADEEWWQATFRDGSFIGQPEYDASSKTIAIVMAVTVRENGDGRVLGVLRTTVNFTTLIDTLTLGLFGQTGHTNIYLPSGQELKLNIKGDKTVELVEEAAPPETEALIQSAAKYQAISLGGIPVLVSSALVRTIGDTDEDTSLVSKLGWRVVTTQDQAEALLPVSIQTRNIIILAVIIIIVVAFAAFGLARVISGPIIHLNTFAGQVASGNLTVEAKVETHDEIGALATTFNSMVAQLRDLIGSLEVRVAARTKDLATVAEVGTATATILETDKLLQAVVTLTKERFDLYHSHIYLLDSAGENLVLASGAGEPGRLMKAKGFSIPLNREQSLVARAAREQKGVIVNDVTQTPDFMPNPLLPETRSELAVPMLISGKLIGVFDIQSDQIDRFTDSDINIQTTLAAQVAASVQNARLFEQSKTQADMESLINTIGQKIQRTATVDDTLQTAIREIGLALGASRVFANIQAARQYDSDEAKQN